MLETIQRLHGCRFGQRVGGRGRRTIDSYEQAVLPLYVCSGKRCIFHVCKKFSLIGLVCRCFFDALRELIVVRRQAF